MTYSEQSKISNFESVHTRYDFLDVAKGIGILFVIIAHINYTPSLLNVIYSFHMPLFFFLSGMVFNRNKYKNFFAFIKRKAQTLLCPYILFYLLSILFHLGIKVVFDAENIDWRIFLSYFIQLFLSQGSAKLPNAPLWFVTCLMLVESIYFWISKLNKTIIIIISAALTSLGWLLESNIIAFRNELLPWSLDSALFAIGFFAIGNLSSATIYSITEKSKSTSFKSIKCIAIFLLICTVLVPLALYNGKVSLGSKILNNGFILYLTGLLGTCGILVLSLLFEKNSFFKYCGKNSFQIMAIHILIREALRLVYKFFDIPIYNKTDIIETIIPVIIVVLSSLIFTLIYNKIKQYLFFRFKCRMVKT